MNSLVSNQKEVLIFRYVEDLPYKDIATIMDKTEGALRVLHNRAIENLKKKIRHLVVLKLLIFVVVMCTVSINNIAL